MTPTYLPNIKFLALLQGPLRLNESIFCSFWHQAKVGFWTFFQNRPGCVPFWLHIILDQSSGYTSTKKLEKRSTLYGWKRPPKFSQKVTFSPCLRFFLGFPIFFIVYLVRLCALAFELSFAMQIPWEAHEQAREQALWIFAENDTVLILD